MTPKSSTFPRSSKIRFGLLLALVASPLPSLAQSATPDNTPISGITGPVGDQLRAWYMQGTAAGNIGDKYDNRDRGHSPLDLKLFPQLRTIAYSEAQLKAREDWGAAKVLNPAVTIGNSSTATPANITGSHVRSYENSPHGINFLFGQFLKSNLYVYPVHHDFHFGHNGSPLYDADNFGDILVTNTPYLIASLGSSYTDQPFLQATAATLAAFRPEVKKRLIETGTLMNTVQMIFRMSNQNVKSMDDYLKGSAHPPVFHGGNLDTLKMIKLAHEITLDTIPPFAAITLTSAPEAIPGKDYFDKFDSETLADTPLCIATIYRSTAATRTYTFSALNSGDVNKKPIKLIWVVLQNGIPVNNSLSKIPSGNDMWRGDVEIKYLNDAHNQAEITIPYHPRAPITPDSTLESNRIDIGVFSHNGSYISAPAFFTSFSLDNEGRTYDAKGRILEVGYTMSDYYIAPGNLSQVLEQLRAPQLSPAYKLLATQFTPEQRKALIKYIENLNTLQIKMKIAQEYLRDSRKSKIDKDIQNAQNTVSALQKSLDGVALQQLEGTQVTPTLALNRAAVKLAHEPQFFSKFGTLLASQWQSASKETKRLIALEQDRLRAYHIAKFNSPDQLNYELTPLRPLATTNPELLTPFEQNALLRYHSALVAYVLLGQQFSLTCQVNYVDPRIATLKTWRDIYHYDALGRCLGWTRYDLTGQSEFTPQGFLITERDSLNRCSMAVRVQYVTAPVPSGVGVEGYANYTTLQAVPTKDKYRYTYAAPDDLLGQFNSANNP